MSGDKKCIVKKKTLNFDDYKQCLLLGIDKFCRQLLF